MKDADIKSLILVLICTNKSNTPLFVLTARKIMPRLRYTRISRHSYHTTLALHVLQTFYFLRMFGYLPLISGSLLSILKSLMTIFALVINFLRTLNRVTIILQDWLFHITILNIKRLLFHSFLRAHCGRSLLKQPLPDKTHLLIMYLPSRSLDYRPAGSRYTKYTYTISDTLLLSLFIIVLFPWSIIAISVPAS